MSFVSYPTAATVENLIRSAGYWPTDSTKQELARIQAQIGVEAARDEFERLTGWTPFLAVAEATERVFDGPDHSGYLDFQGAAVAVSSVAISGVVQTLGTQYQLQPQNALSRGEPILGLQLGCGTGYRYSFAYHGSIAVVARWGRLAEIPGDVYQAILQKAALVVLTQVENLQSVASISEDGFSKAYDVVGIVTQKDLAAGGIGGGGIWGSNFEKIAARWKRVVS